MKRSEQRAQTKVDRIKSSLMSDIANGRLRPGDRVQSERELTRELGVSLGTVQRALRELADQGIVKREHGRGTFVSNVNAAVGVEFLRFRDENGEELPLYVQVLGKRRIVRDGPWTAFFGAGDDLVRIDRWFNVGGSFDLFNEFYLKSEDFALLRQISPGSVQSNLRELLVQRLALSALRVEQSIRFEPLPRRIAKHLDHPIEQPGVIMELRAIADEGRPLFYQRSFATHFFGASLVVTR